MGPEHVPRLVAARSQKQERGRGKMQLIVERDGPVVTLTINRPEVMNAMTREMYADLTDTLRAMDRDDEVHAVVITGTGDRAFSSGADLRLFHSPEDANSPWRPWSANRWDL